jgi:sec-independent protein translocase protein TatA
MLGNLTGWHALIILAVVVLIFGAAKLPALARSVGQSVRILQKEVQKDKRDPETPTTAAVVEPEVTSAGNA